MKKQSIFKTFISEIPQNLFAGFVVSLIALPLGLGLALASVTILLFFNKPKIQYQKHPYNKK